MNLPPGTFGNDIYSDDEYAHKEFGKKQRVILDITEVCNMKSG